jgi:lytic murein transglycosylase
MISHAVSFRTIAAAVFCGLATPVFAAQCGGDFNGFLGQMARDAEAAGIRPAIVNQAFTGLTPDQEVIRFDHRQRGMFNSKPFEEYVRTRVTAGRIAGAKKRLQQYGNVLRSIEQRTGVPPEIILAVWGLETDFGTADMGRRPVVRTLATLAHDCRRSELFQGELIAALKILQRGDLPQRDLIGAFAGEIGQTQFLPSSYIKYGVDADGNGHVDLRHSAADVLASTANLLAKNGWQRGQPYTEGTANFTQAMREWNRSELYRKTIVYFAQRIRQ